LDMQNFRSFARPRRLKRVDGEDARALAMTRSKRAHSHLLINFASKTIGANEKGVMPMVYPFSNQSYFLVAIVLICITTLGACSTMEKSSTTRRSMESLPPETPDSRASSSPKFPASPARAATESTQPSTQSAPPAVQPEAAPVHAVAPPSVQPEATTDETAATPENSITTQANDDADSVKRQLAEEQERIDQLRREREQDIAKEESQSSQEPSAQTGFETGPSVPAASTRRVASPVAATKPEDQIADFPTSPNVAEAKSPESTPLVELPLQRSIYFDYDKAVIKETYDSVLLANGAYLKAHPSITAEIEGNCDERGSREYNLALGARRAAEVKQALELQGVDGKRIKTVSFGSEKPIALGKDEESYSKNRRADIVN
jgi:peptidoglycan-associated lipoprotein